MPNSSNTINAEAIQSMEGWLIQQYIFYCTTALVVYEYWITVTQEIHIVWQRKWTGVTLLLLFNRYLLLALVVLQVLPTVTEVCQMATVAQKRVDMALISCNAMVRTGEVIALSQILVFALFSALRVYAVWDQNIALSLLVMMLNVVPFITNMYGDSSVVLSYVDDPILGKSCLLSNRVSPEDNFRLCLVTRLSATAADAIVLCISLSKAFKARSGSPLIRVLLRDGALYFMTLFLLNIAQIALETVPAWQAFAPVIPFITSLSPILVSRFLLNLRQIRSNSGEQNTLQQTVTASSSHINSTIIGNLGGSLDHGFELEAEYIPAQFVGAES